MTDEHAFLQAILAEPDNLDLRLVFADWLEERGDPRGQLLRMMHHLTQRIDFPGRAAMEEEYQALLDSGVKPIVPTLTSSIGMKLVLIPSGRFLMGSPPEEAERRDDEQLHEVEITRSFLLGMYTVTQEEYETVMGANPSYFSRTGGGKGKLKQLDPRRFPGETVSWDDAVEFCRKLSDLAEEKKAGRGYRLPTEAEWEYACRGARQSLPFHFGRSLASQQANFNGNYPCGDAPKGKHLQRTTTVGSYLANDFDLYDMHGNVWEWCHDWYGKYGKKHVKDYKGPENGDGRVLRGGSCISNGRNCRAACRIWNAPVDRDNLVGFRVVCVVACRTL